MTKQVQHRVRYVCPSLRSHEWKFPCPYFKFLYLKGRIKETHVFHLLGQSAASSQSGARPKAGVGSFWISHVGGRDSGTWAILCCLLGCISRELGSKWSSCHTNWCPYELPASQVAGLYIMPHCWPLSILNSLKDGVYGKGTARDLALFFFF